MRRASAPQITPAICRPQPPVDLRDLAVKADPLYGAEFTPAPDVAAWIRDTFLDEGAPLENPDHAHLRDARLGVVWTNVDNLKQMRTVVGTAEIPNPKGGAWMKARQLLQLAQWCGGIVPDFLITLSAPYCAEASDAQFCALVEHELYHCAQAVDSFGSPRFHRDNSPVWAIRGHDVEEFVGVVARYGADSAAGVRALVAAANRGPQLPAESVAGACGTCLAKVA